MSLHSHRVCCRMVTFSARVLKFTKFDTHVEEKEGLTTNKPSFLLLFLMINEHITKKDKGLTEQKIHGSSFVE